jgi:phosphoesterase RecJ-like protein
MPEKTSDQSVKQLKKLVEAAQTILILQPEKPDTDSLTSILALEQILGDINKEVILYCQDALPKYINYFEGADRVRDDFPKHFDLAILVDTGGPQQIARTLEKHGSSLSKKPFAVIDHHANRSPLPFDVLEIIDTAATSTCETVVKLAEELGWKINQSAANLLIPGILADTRNFSIQATSPETLETVAKAMRWGGDIYKSHQDYWAASALTPDLLAFKGRLLGRMEIFCDGKIALVTVTPEELRTYAEAHDPADLVIYDLQNLQGVACAVVMRNYDSALTGNKIKVSTRARMPVAAKTCEKFGGGGHDRAAGCQINDRPIAEAKQDFVAALCQNIKDYEALQHANSN